MIKKRCSVLALGLLAFHGICGSQQSAALTPLNPQDIQMVNFEEMKYPESALRAPFSSEGVVVVQISLDGQGKVSSANALSGNPLLVPDTLANIKKWRFSSKGKNTAIIVYNFRSIRGDCGFVRSLFAFEPPNFVTVMGCIAATVESRVTVGSGSGTDVSDDDIDVLHFDSDLRYPPLARTARIGGVVVVQARLSKDGKVVQASVLSGHPLLAACCLENAKKWVFEPNPTETALIVYDLRVRDVDVTQFLFERPNLVTLTAGAPIVEPSSRSSLTLKH
jgi:TonB family protein